MINMNVGVGESTRIRNKCLVDSLWRGRFHEPRKDVECKAVQMYDRREGCKAVWSRPPNAGGWKLAAAGWK